MTSLHPFGSGKIEVKMKVVGFDAADGLSLAQAEIHAHRQMMGLIHHLQTRGYGGRHAAGGGRPLSRHALASVSRAIGQREGRRIAGKHTLTEAEITRGAVFDDAVAVGTYHLDFHWPETERRAATGITTMVEPYHIPLRAMQPEALDNVLCPGRGLSGDQMALSSYRAMATCVQMGWAAGRAAGMSLNEATPLKELHMPPPARHARGRRPIPRSLRLWQLSPLPASDRRNPGRAVRRACRTRQFRALRCAVPRARLPRVPPDCRGGRPRDAAWADAFRGRLAHPARCRLPPPAWHATRGVDWPGWPDCGDRRRRQRERHAGRHPRAG